MTSTDQENQSVLEGLVAASSAIKEAKGLIKYTWGTNKSTYSRLAKAHAEIADAIGIVSKRIST